MDDDSRYVGLSKHSIDLHIDIEDESEEDDDLKPEYVCPFCLEDFDLVGFCCHIDEAHPVEARTGICPICEKRTGINTAVHIITQHGSILKAIYKKKLCGGGVYSSLSSLRKNTEDEHLEPFLDGSSCVVPSSNLTADPLLSSFIYNPPAADAPESLQSSFTTKANLSQNSSGHKISERAISSPKQNKDEKAQKYWFVQGLLYSIIHEDLSMR
ncbi:protein DEHYDRATION-INDUCED 19 homolog 4-like isoform X2 [Diospyros lotus]|uniref:protein DEHYDRATION-INDUCED 19 homolog 4-like isoform X2 n=1 Tax=Diospyros lotus TaxID=55363 RepID=UPI00225BF7BF|nr:protein DEHYDRATION-INDUCED 19 homolog 4-like isoform X2 [Diospyros lotus]